MACGPQVWLKKKERKNKLYKENVKNDTGMNLYCIRYDFSAALISALALLKYANVRLTVVV